MKVLCAVLLAACSSPGASTTPTGKVVSPIELGKLAFHDQSLSEPAGQACADCHDDTKAFRDPETDHTSSMGVVPGRFGSRNSPSAMYTAQVPALHFEGTELVGGLFWDGRADTLELQASSPMLNPLEMNNPDREAVVAKLRLSDYADQFRKVYGADALDDVDTAFDHLMSAIGDYERSPQLAPFEAKYDRYLAGRDKLSRSEARGLAIFEDSARGNCSSCHPSRPGADGSPPMFTTFGYANIGVPRYANNLFYLQPL
ncbi:MAG TPA: cytochrome c peroxidase, partial [Kofleriaceae bacterium]